MEYVLYVQLERRNRIEREKEEEEKKKRRKKRGRKRGHCAENEKRKELTG